VYVYGFISAAAAAAASFPCEVKVIIGQPSYSQYPPYPPPFRKEQRRMRKMRLHNQRKKSSTLLRFSTFVFLISCVEVIYYSEMNLLFKLSPRKTLLARNTKRVFIQLLFLFSKTPYTYYL